MRNLLEGSATGAIQGLPLTPENYGAAKDILKKRFGQPHVIIREFKQIATAGATTAAVTEKVWGEYVAAVCQILAK